VTTTGGLEAPAWGGFDPARAERDRSGRWPAFLTSVRLGWQVEANWTDPFLFFIYSVAKPLSATLILVVMIDIISGGGAGPYRAFVVVGTALWSIVLSGLSGLAWTILDDRERYRMLKYVYVSPSDFLMHLVGRSIARLAVGVMGAIITIIIGVLLLGVPISLEKVDVPLLLADIVGGLWVILAIGTVLGAVSLQTRQESWQYPEAMAGALFLISGAVFPLSVLPAPMQAVGLAGPLTWWIEGFRHAVFPGGPSGVGGPGSVWEGVTGTAAPDPAIIVGALLATGALVTLAAIGVFRVSERRAKERGLLDQTTGS